MTNGDPSGTGGGRRWLATGWGVVAAVVAGVAFINIVTITHEQPQHGLLLPVVWEGSSALASIAFAWLPWAVMRWSASWPRWRAAAVHAPAALLYSALHVGGFVALRTLAYASAGERYDFGPIGKWLTYELQKDLLAYALMVTTYWLARRMGAQGPPPPAEPPVFDIRDGARIVRAPLADILAVASAGNYAEFVLADGRRPLMRSSLAALEKALAPRGFVRTHRSWLVNAARVTGLKPGGSGDYVVELGALEAPLSRRFPEALARLRQG